jgi:hypothetical protein
VELWQPSRDPVSLGPAGGDHGAAQETGSALPGVGQPERPGLLILKWGRLVCEQRDHKTEQEKLAAALDIFTKLNMPRQRGPVQAELENTR